MADISITAANVIAASGSTKINGTAGATVTAGQIVYLDPADSEYKLADADNVPSGGFSQLFMALNGAADGQPLRVLSAGTVALGSVLTAGTTYYLSPTAGGIAPVADILTGDNVIVLGVASSASNLKFQPIISGVTL